MKEFAIILAVALFTFVLFNPTQSIAQETKEAFVKRLGAIVSKGDTTHFEYMLIAEKALFGTEERSYSALAKAAMKVENLGHRAYDDRKYQEAFVFFSTAGGAWMSCGRHSTKYYEDAIRAYRAQLKVINGYKTKNKKDEREKANMAISALHFIFKAYICFGQPDLALGVVDEMAGYGEKDGFILFRAISNAMKGDTRAAHKKMAEYEAIIEKGKKRLH